MNSDKYVIEIVNEFKDLKSFEKSIIPNLYLVKTNVSMLCDKEIKIIYKFDGDATNFTNIGSVDYGGNYWYLGNIIYEIYHKNNQIYLKKHSYSSNKLKFIKTDIFIKTITDHPIARIANCIIWYKSISYDDLAISKSFKEYNQGCIIIYNLTTDKKITPQGDFLLGNKDGLLIIKNKIIVIVNAPYYVLYDVENEFTVRKIPIHTNGIMNKIKVIDDFILLSSFTDVDATKKNDLLLFSLNKV